MSNEAVFDGYTREELQAAFDRVKSKDGWKYPINTVITVQERDKELGVIEAAVGFFAGGGCEFRERPGGKVLVTAPGYYALIGS